MELHDSWIWIKFTPLPKGEEFFTYNIKTRKSLQRRSPFLWNDYSMVYSPLIYSVRARKGDLVIARSHRYITKCFGLTTFLNGKSKRIIFCCPTGEKFFSRGAVNMKGLVGYFVRIMRLVSMSCPSATRLYRYMPAVNVPPLMVSVPLPFSVRLYTPFCAPFRSKI